MVQVLPFVFYTLEEWDWTGQSRTFLKMNNENCLVDNVPLSCLVQLSGYIQLLSSPSLTPSQLLHLDDLIRTHHLTMTEVILINILVYIQCNYSIIQHVICIYICLWFTYQLYGREVTSRGNIHCGFHMAENIALLGHPNIGDVNRFERHHHVAKDIGKFSIKCSNIFFLGNDSIRTQNFHS